MSRRDEEHALEHFTAARELVQYEADRMAAIFSAFLLANTLLMGFLLHTAVGSNDFPGQPGKAVVGGVLGLCVSVLWLAAYEHVAASVDMRIARAREIEPEGWELLTGRPHSFSHGKEVAFDGEDEPMRVTGFARLGIRNAARLLIAVFMVVYATVAVWGFVDAVT